MALNFNSFSQWVQNQAVAVQTSAAAMVDFTSGSIVRAILEANASVALWIQWLILTVLQRTRLSTSSGADIDSFVGDFGLTRLPAVAATGMVTFSRFTAGLQSLITPGVSVKSSDGTQLFTVTTDTTQASWSAALGGYVLAASVASLAVPVQAVSAGTQGNVSAGTISLLASAVPGVDTVSNAAAFTNGIDPESDAALQARFALFIPSRTRATMAAIGYAVQSTMQGLTYTIAENVSSIGAYQPGNFIVYVDDGSGAPPSSTISAVSASISQYRGVGSTYAVFGPTLITANVAFTMVAAPGYVHGNLTGPAALAVTAYIDALPMGAALAYSRIAQIVYDSSPGVANVTGITLNGATSDLGGTGGSVVRAGTVVAS